MLDTNIWISAMHSPSGPAREVVDLVLEKKIRMHLTVPLVLEYEEKLRDLKELHNLGDEEITDLVNLIIEIGRHGQVYYLHPFAVRDPDDAHVFEAVTSTPAQALITRNTVDFVGKGSFFGASCWGVPIIKPKEYLKGYRNSQHTL